MQSQNLAEITIKRTDKVWLYAFSVDKRYFRFINQKNIRYLAGSADYARNALNAAILGLVVHAHGAFNAETRILTIEP